jgi:hypothetical protein
MKSVLAIVMAALALSASSAFAQAQSAPVAKIAPAAQEAKLTDIDAKAFPQVKAGILEAIDARVKLLQDDRKCVAAAADGKAVGDCKKASETRQRAMVEQMRRSQGPATIVGAPAPGTSAGARH